MANQYPGSTIEILSDATYGTTMLTFVDLTVNLNGYTIARTDTTARWFVGGIEQPETTGGAAPETLPVVVINGGENGGAIKDADGASGDISTPLITAQYADITFSNVTMVNNMFNDDASAFCLRNGANATLNDCDLSSCCGIKIFNDVGDTASSLMVNGGSVTSMCTLDEALWKGSAIFAELGCQYEVTISLNNVALSATKTAALTLSPRCHVTIKDSTLTGYTGIYAKAADVVIENSTITATGKDINTAFAPGCFDGSGILIDSDNKFVEPVQIALSADTTVTSANGYGIREVGGLDGTGVSAAQIDNAGAQLSGALGDVALLPAQ